MAAWSKLETAHPFPGAMVDRLIKNISIMSRNNTVLASLVSQVDTQGGAPNELRVLLQDTSALARETGEYLLNMQREVSPAAMPPRQRAMMTKLNKDFQFVLRRFQQLAQQSADRAQQHEIQEMGPSLDIADEQKGSVAADHQFISQQRQQLSQ